MKRYLLLTVMLGFLFTTNVHGQRWLHPGYTLKQIDSVQTLYFDSLRVVIGDSAMRSEGSEWSDYLRYYTYWKRLLGPTGDFISYFSAVSTYYETATTNCPTPPLTGTNMSDTWVEIGPYTQPTINAATINASSIGPMEFVEFCSTPPYNQVMLAGSLMGGLFKSLDGGNNWLNAGTDFSPAWKRSGCSSAAISPNDDAKWYATSSGQGDGNPVHVGYAGGAYRTFNAGVTWEQIFGYTPALSVWTLYNKILPMSSDGKIELIATNRGLYRPTNTNGANDPVVGNITWANVLPPFTGSDDVFDVERKPGSYNDAYVTFRISGVCYIQKSSNAGLTWTNLPGTPPVTLASAARVTIEVCAADPTKLYVLICAPNSYMITSLYVYDVTSSTWSTLIATGTANKGYGHAFGVDQFNPNIVYIGNGVSANKITISSFSSVALPYGTSTYHMDVEDIVGSPVNSGEMWFATHGGLAKYDGNLTWTAQSQGLGVAVMYGFAESKSSPNYISMGLYHNGPIVTTGPAYGPAWNPSWNLLAQCDGMPSLIDPFNDQNMYASCVFGGWYNTTNAFGSTANSVPLSSSDWTVYGALNKIKPEYVYRVSNPPPVSSWQLYRSTNFAGLTNIIISPPNMLAYVTGATAYQIHDIYTSETNAGYLCIQVKYIVGANEIHVLLRTKIADDPNPLNIALNSAWEVLRLPREGFWPGDVEFDLNNPNILYISYSSSSIFGPGPNVNCGTEMIYKIDFTTPSSILANTCAIGCTDLTSNLPNSGSGAICQEKMSAGSIYLATDQGVFFTNNILYPGHGWYRFGNSPHVTGSAIDINYKVNKIRLSLYGRGVWERNLYCSPNTNLTFANTTVSTSYFHETRGSITSQSMLVSPVNISYRAGSTITLQPGFSVATNCTFHAFIHDCDGPSNSFVQRMGDTDEEDEENEFDDKDAEVTIFPNPSTGQFSIVLKSEEEEDGAELQQLSVFDINGHIVSEFKLTGVHVFQLHLEDQPAGIYLARITTSKGIYTKRIIIFKE